MKLQLWILAVGLILPKAMTHADQNNIIQVKADKSLEGEWQLVELELNGKKSITDNVKQMRMIFKDDKMTVKSAQGEGAERKKKFKLDPSKIPKQIDITSLDGQEKGETHACIYSLENGLLKLCMPHFTKAPNQRPAKFTTKDKDGYILLVLKRVAK